MLHRSGHLLRTYWLETVMVLPLALYIGLLTLVPVLQAIGLSFTDRYSGAFPTLSNYQYIVSRPDFGAAVVNTIGITLIGVTLEMTVGLILALMLARHVPGARPLPHHHPDPDGRPDAGGGRRDALLLPHQRLRQRAAAPDRA